MRNIQGTSKERVIPELEEEHNPVVRYAGIVFSFLIFDLGLLKT